jgi:hypothetical protein
MADHLPSNPNPLTTPTRAAETLAALYGQLETTTNLVDLDNIQKRADALHHMAGLAKLHRQWQNRFFGLRIHALCRWGEIYAATEKNKGGDPLLIAEGGQTLAEMGVSYNFSSECQRLSRIPKEVLHTYLAAGEAADDDSEVAELSKAGLFAFAKAAAEPEPIRPEPPNPADGVTVSPEPPTPEPAKPEPPNPEPEPEVGDSRIVGYTKDPKTWVRTRVAPDDPNATEWEVEHFVCIKKPNPLWRTDRHATKSLADAEAAAAKLRGLAPAVQQIASVKPAVGDYRIVGFDPGYYNLPLPVDHPGITELEAQRFSAVSEGVWIVVPLRKPNSLIAGGVIRIERHNHIADAAAAIDAEKAERARSAAAATAAQSRTTTRSRKGEGSGGKGLYQPAGLDPETARERYDEIFEPDALEQNNPLVERWLDGEPPADEASEASYETLDEFGPQHVAAVEMLLAYYSARHLADAMRLLDPDRSRVKLAELGTDLLDDQFAEIDWGVKLPSEIDSIDKLATGYAELQTEAERLRAENAELKAQLEASNVIHIRRADNGSA